MDNLVSVYGQPVDGLLRTDFQTVLDLHDSMKKRLGKPGGR
jgi:hypothetical protein